MTTTDIRPGDVVRLNSGGPNMLVVGVRPGEHGAVSVIWTGEDEGLAVDTMRLAMFDPRTVTVVAPRWDGQPPSPAWLAAQLEREQTR